MSKNYVHHLQKLASRWDNLLENPSFQNKKYYELYEQSRTIISLLCKDAQEFLQELDKTPSQSNIERLIGKLRATQLDLESGILRLEHQIQDKVAIDLMQQAEELLVEDGTSRTHSHIPAAVLAGAVLEHFLRTLCGRQSPPIPLTLENGNFKTLATLVGDLEKVDLYNSVEKKQLKVWVEIRNHAAHGQFDQFKVEQVKSMIDDIKRFIETHE